MRCTHCGTEFEGNSCPSCGQPASTEAYRLPEICGRCGTSFAGHFCPNCGWPAGAPFPMRRQISLAWSILGVLWMAAILLFLVYTTVILVALLYISPLVVGGILTSTCDICLAYFFVVNPLKEVPFEVVGFGEQALLIWFMVVLAALVGVYLYLILFYGRITYRDATLPVSKVSTKVRSESTLIMVGQIFMAVLFFQTLYIILFLPLIGIDPKPPSIVEELPQWYNLYSLVNAAVWEEVATRLLLIGIPLTLGSLAFRVSQTLSGRALRSGGTVHFLAGSFKYILGGQIDGSSPVLVKILGTVLVLISALLFGYAHVPSWGAWKFVDASVAGLALGYLFIRKGLVASILLHFSVNSLGVLTIALGGEESLVALVTIGIFYLGLAAMGSGFFVYYVKEIGRLLFKPLFGPSKKVAVGPQRPGRSPATREELPYFPVACSRCGGREAIYQDGALTCSTCGSRL
ncbi:MAG: type II CAAX prenyl endopeptidase Rce1 family protein [Thermoplasmata archaeon]